MARLWNQADDQRWPESMGTSAQVSSKPIEAINLLFRDVVRGSVAYLLALLRYRLRIASSPTRTLTEEMIDQCNQRLFAAWLAAPIADLPDDLGGVSGIDTCPFVAAE